VSDVDECERGLHDPNCHVCHNLVGSYTCKCNEFFVLDTSTNQTCIGVHISRILGEHEAYFSAAAKIQAQNKGGGVGGGVAAGIIVFLLLLVLCAAVLIFLKRRR
jgi:hypothetical protein